MRTTRKELERLRARLQETTNVPLEFEGAYGGVKLINGDTQQDMLCTGFATPKRLKEAMDAALMFQLNAGRKG